MTAIFEDTNERWYFAIGLIIGVIIGAVITIAITPFTTPEAPLSVSSSALGVVPSVFQLQQRLCEAGYDIEIDGICGPETIKAWDDYIHNKFANKVLSAEWEALMEQNNE
jgi:hypothetical protein